MASDATAFSVVVLIDMQSRFIEQLKGGVAEHLMTAQLQVLAHCAARDIPLVVLEYDGFGLTVEPLQGAIRRVLRHTFVVKGTDDGFNTCQLYGVLQAYEAETILFMGINAEACVRDTAASALRHGYHIVTAEALIASACRARVRRSAFVWYKRNGVLFRGAALPISGY